MRRTIGMAVAIALATVVPVAADPAVIKGLDIWYTPSGGAIVTVNIPAGFFCGGNSAAQTRTVSLKGRALVTNPAGKIAPGDTVVDREADIPFNLNGGLKGIGNLRIRALDLVSVQDFTVSCPGGLTQVFGTEVSLNGAQGLGTIEIRKPALNARFGRFDASFPVAGKVRFVNRANGARTGFLPDNATITTLDACWSHDPGPGAVVCAGPVTIDTDGNRVITVADHTSPYCTSNFFPGWTYSGGVVVQCPTKHDGPHPTTCGAPGTACPEQDVANPCTTEVEDYLATRATAEGFLLDNTAALDSKFSKQVSSGTGTGVLVGSVDVVATKEFMGSVRVDRCIQATGAAILDKY